MEFRDIVSYSGAEFEDQTSLPLPMTFMISEEAQWDADVCSHQPIIMNDDYFLNPCSFPDDSSINFMHSSMTSPPRPPPPSCSLDDDDEVDKTSENCVKRKPMDDEDSQKQHKSSKKKQRQELQQEEEETEQKEKQQSKRISRRGCATDAQSVYARKRRERITERLKTLQKLVPNGTKVDISTMLEQAIHYVKFMQLQIKLLSSDQHWMYTPIAFNGSFPNMDLDIL